MKKNLCFLLLLFSWFCSYAQDDPNPYSSPKMAAVAIESDMIEVQGGTYMMGCHTTNGTRCYPNEKPAHAVTVSSFKIGKTEITQGMYKAIIGKSESGDCDFWDCPQSYVSYSDATDFCKKLSALSDKNYTLPTEAEWEFAAGGGIKSQGLLYAGSADINEVAWYGKSQVLGIKKLLPHRVATKKPNELGIYDMTGNVSEWCLDWFDGKYYSGSPANDPQGPVTGNRRVNRGGNYYLEGDNCRITTRSDCGSSQRNQVIGFRVVSHTK